MAVRQVRVNALDSLWRRCVESALLRAESPQKAQAHEPRQVLGDGLVMPIRNGFPNVCIRDAMTLLGQVQDLPLTFRQCVDGW